MNELNVEYIRKQILDERQSQAAQIQSTRHMQEIEHLPIDKRIEIADQEVFWRYFVSQVLRLSLLLICEDMPDTLAGLVLPLQKKADASVMTDPKDLHTVGLSLVGWLGRNQTFYAFLDMAPSFEFPSDFRIEPLRAVGEEKTRYTPLLIVQRKAWLFPLSDPVLKTIQRLLGLVYKYVDQCPSCSDYCLRHRTYHVPPFHILPPS